VPEGRLQPVVELSDICLSYTKSTMFADGHAVCRYCYRNSSSQKYRRCAFDMRFKRLVTSNTTTDLFDRTGVGLYFCRRNLCIFNNLSVLTSICRFLFPYFIFTIFMAKLSSSLPPRIITRLIKISYN